MHDYISEMIMVSRIIAVPVSKHLQEKVFCTSVIFLKEYRGGAPELYKAKEGDTIGVFVTPSGDLHFTVNEIDYGTAWRDLPTDQPLYPVVFLNGKCEQISVAQKMISKFKFNVHSYVIFSQTPC